MRKTELHEVKKQIHLHENLKRWMHLSLGVVSCLFVAMYSVRNAALWLRGSVLVLLVLSIMIWLIIGFAVWRSRKYLLNRLA